MVKEMVGGCCVCSDERGWDENPLVYCDGHGCNVAVHQACYGIVQVPKGPWFCRKCESQERIARVKCELCPIKEGALKRTDTGGWAHVLCALYIPEVRFGNVSTMEPIILSSVPHEKFQKTCYLCEEHGRESKTSAGACMQCNKVGCRQAFHVTCAQAAKLLCEEQQGVSANTVKYVGYCSYHWNKKGKGVVIPRPNDRARSKAEGRTMVQKPDITKRPSVIGTTKSTESPSPPGPPNSAKPKNRKLSSKASDIFLEPLSATDSSSLPGSQHLMKITSPLNTPSVRDHMTNFASVVSTHFPFQHSAPKPEAGSGPSAVSNGILNPVLAKSTAAVAQAQYSKEAWKSPPSASAAKKCDKSEKTANNTSTVSSSETKSSNTSSSSSITKKRKTNKTGSADEDGKKKQKTNASHDKKSSYSLGAVGKGKMPVLPPSPFISKSSSSIREMEIPTKLDDFLEFQWKQGVEFLSHQPGYLDVASLLSCLHQLKHENVKLETRLSELVKRRDHLLLVNSRLSKPLNLSAVTSPTSGTQEVRKTDSASPGVVESTRNTSSERINQPFGGKSPENGSSETDMLAKDGQESSQVTKQQDPKIQTQTKELFPTKKEQQRQRPQSEVQLPQTVKESSQQILEMKSPVKVDTPPTVDNNERLREAASSPPRGNKSVAVEGKSSSVALSGVVAAERPQSRQSPKSRKSPQGSGGKNAKLKSQEQLYQQEHQKMMQQQHQQLKQQQLSRQKFQQSHLLPLQQGNQQFNQHFAHQNSQLAFFKLPAGYNSPDQHAMHQSKQGQVSMNGSPQQYNSQSLPRQFPNFVPYIAEPGIHNVRMQGYMPVYPVESPLNKVMEEKIDSSAGMDKAERRN